MPSLLRGRRREREREKGGGEKMSFRNTRNDASKVPGWLPCIYSVWERKCVATPFLRRTAASVFSRPKRTSEIGNRYYRDHFIVVQTDTRTGDEVSRRGHLKLTRVTAGVVLFFDSFRRKRNTEFCTFFPPHFSKHDRSRRCTRSPTRLAFLDQASILIPHFLPIRVISECVGQGELDILRLTSPVGPLAIEPVGVPFETHLEPKVRRLVHSCVFSFRFSSSRSCVVALLVLSSSP